MFTDRPLQSSRLAVYGGGPLVARLLVGLGAGHVVEWTRRIAGSDAVVLERAGSRWRLAELGQAVLGADVLILGQGPARREAAPPALQEALRRRPTLVISLVQGASVAALRRWLGCAVPMVRAVPEPTARSFEGGCSVFATPDVHATQRRLAEQLLDAVGWPLMVPFEELLEPVAALTGCEGGCAFLLPRVLAQLSLGLSPVRKEARLRAMFPGGTLGLVETSAEETLRLSA